MSAEVEKIVSAEISRKNCNVYQVPKKNIVVRCWIVPRYLPKRIAACSLTLSGILSTESCIIDSMLLKRPWECTFTYGINGIIRCKIKTFSLLEIFNMNTFLKSVSTSKSRVTYDLDTDRVTYDLDTGTTTHKIIGVVGSPLYLATPVSTALLKFHLSL